MGTGRVAFINCCVSKLKSLTTCSEYFFIIIRIKKMYYAPISSFALGSAIAPVAEWFRALNHSTISSLCLDSSQTWDTCETSRVLLAGVPGGFSRGWPVFASPTVWPVSYEPK